MGEEFYCSIKLVSGEEVFSLISIDENDGDPMIIMQNPVIMKVVQNDKGMYVKIKPWMEIPDDDIYIIKYDKVLTMTEIDNPMTIGFYEKYINDEQDDISGYEEKHDGEVKISNKMGYISSVDDARTSLERIFNKDLKEN